MTYIFFLYYWLSDSVNTCLDQGIYFWVLINLWIGIQIIFRVSFYLFYIKCIKSYLLHEIYCIPYICLDIKMMTKRVLSIKAVDCRLYATRKLTYWYKKSVMRILFLSNWHKYFYDECVKEVKKQYWGYLLINVWNNLLQ